MNIMELNKENPKHTDHHFTKMSEYKYNLIEVQKLNETDQRLIIGTLRRENESLKNERKKFKATIETIKTSIESLELFANVQKLGATFQKGGITNNSEGPEMVVNTPQNKTICPKCRSKKIAISEFWKESLCVDCDYRWEW